MMTAPYFPDWLKDEPQYPIPGFSAYSITRGGFVISNMRSKPHLMKSKWRDKIEFVNIRNDAGEGVTLSIARLLLMTFISLPPTADAQASFKDGNSRNYALDNLRWISPADKNAEIRQRSGWLQRPIAVRLYMPQKGRRMYKLTAEKIADMRAMHAEGKPYHEIAAAYGISTNHVWRVIADYKPTNR